MSQTVIVATVNFRLASPKIPLHEYMDRPGGCCVHGCDYAVGHEGPHDWERRWRDMTPTDLREALRRASWRTNKFDGKSLDTLVRNRVIPKVAALIESVLNPLEEPTP